jgi:hypothetical protein
MSVDQPERLISVAARISQRIANGLPSGPTTSKWMYEWGFTSSMLVSVPEYSFGVFMSNSRNRGVRAPGRPSRALRP